MHSPDRGAIVELSRAEIDSFLRQQRIARLGCHLDGLTYVVPVIYAFDGASIFVVTTEGQKVSMMRSSPRVCVEVDEYDTSGSWRSVIAYGDYEELEGNDVEEALAALRDAFGRAAPAEPRGLGPGVVVFRIRLDELTGRSVAR